MTAFARRHPLLCLLCSAAATAATLIWTWLAPLEWISMVPLVAVLLTMASAPGIRLRRLYGYGLFYCFLYQSAVYHWFFYLYPLEFTGMGHGAAMVVCIVACFGLALLHGSIFALAFPLFGLLSRTPLCTRFRLIRLPLLSAVWCVFEWMQTQTWIGVPWGRLALGQVGWLPVIQTAEWLGSYLITFLLVLVNGCIAEACRRPARAASYVLAALIAFGGNFVAGSALYLADEAQAARRETIVAAAVQGNISSSVKWSSNALSQTLEAYDRLTGKAAAQGAELVIWPESVIPYTLARYPSLTRTVEQISLAYGVDLLVGAFADGEKGMLNVMLPVTPEEGVGESGYAKRHLVPFGEYLPMASLIERVIPPLAELQMMGSDLVAGDNAAIAEIGGARVGSLICFDSIYETLALDSVRAGANLIALSTNDSWFADSAAVYQHNAQAVLRAVETRRSIVRAANTGVSSIITPRGTLTDSLAPLVEGQITAAVELNETRTLYTRVGNLLIWLCMAFCGVCLFSDVSCGKHRKTKNVSNVVDNQMTV